MRAAAVLTRRRLLRRSALLPLVSLPLLQACAKTGPAHCADPELLSRGEEQMRKTRAYVVVSDVAGQQCVDCAFFAAGEIQECGHCEILDGPVNAPGHCSSWAQRV